MAGDVLSIPSKVLVHNSKIIIIIIIIWRNRHFFQVAENLENDCLCFQLCFAELKDYKGRSKRLFELILAFQGGFWCVLY